MRKKSPASTFLRLSLLGGFLLASSQVYASGFQIWEQTAYGLGDYHAGAAAEADDASLEFYNAAQITQIHHPELSTGGVLIPVETRFKGSVDASTNVVGKSNTLSFVPNIHYVMPISDKWYMSLGVTTPFGLETNYKDSGNPIENAATVTKILTINVNPSVAYAVTPDFSLAVGFDAMYGSATYDNNVPGFGLFNNKLSGWGFGYNAGAFYKLTDDTKFGVSYRSEINVDASGDSTLPGGNPSYSIAKAKFPLPATTTVSVVQRLSPRAVLMASAFYTQWSKFSLLTLENTAAGTIPVHENYRNTWNLAIGTKIDISKSFQLELGTGWDQTPTEFGYRDVRLPGTDRIALSTGFHWQVLKWAGVDMGYTHLFTPTAHVNNAQSAAQSHAQVPVQIGTATMEANVFGAQLTMTL